MVFDFSHVTLGDIAGVVAVLITALTGAVTTGMWIKGQNMTLDSQSETLAKQDVTLARQDAMLAEHSRALNWLMATVRGIATREKVPSNPPPALTVPAEKAPPTLVAIPWDDQWTEIVAEAKRR